MNSFKHHRLADLSQAIYNLIIALNISSKPDITKVKTRAEELANDRSAHPSERQLWADIATLLKNQQSTS